MREPNRSHLPHVPEPTECRECGTVFDLARQDYYANLCPSCVEDEDE